MVRVRIFCHADIQALQDRRSEHFMGVELVALGSVGIASDSCALLLDLIEGDVQCPPTVKLMDRRYWRCPQMDILSLVAGVALELHKIKHDLYPLLVSHEAKLGGLLLPKNSAVTLVRLAKDAKEIVEGLESDDMDVLLGKVEKVGKVVEATVDLILKGTQNIAWLQKQLPSVLDPVNRLLSTPVHFPDPNA